MKKRFLTKVLRLWTLLWAFSPAFASEVIYVTDLEGRRGNIDQLIREGRLREVNGQLDFVDKTSHLVFGGDINDRGPDSIKLRRWFMGLKERSPERVTLIWGNRDLNKLGLARELIALDHEMSPKYRDWLLKKLAADSVPIPSDPVALQALLKSNNTKANQILWWTDFQGIPKALEFHRQELEALTKKSITMAEAADDMARSLDPKTGDYFKYLKMGQLGDIVDGHIAIVHGGITRENYGIVPGTTEKLSPKQWISRLNEYGSQQLELFQSDLAAGRTNGSSKILVYGDAVWNDSLKQVMSTDQSVVYPYRVKASGNFRLPEDQVVKYLSQDGIDTVVVGHSPVGNTPLPLRKPGFLYFHADTSYGPTGTATSVLIDNGTVRVHGMAADGTALDYTVSPKSNDIIGYQYGDSVVSGKTKDGRYVLNRYYDGYKIQETLVSPSEIDRARITVPIAAVNEEVEKQRKVVSEALLARGKQITRNMEELGGEYAGKRPVLFSGASKLSFEDGSEAKVREAVAGILSRLDPKKEYIVTGGTDFGVEKVVHEEALKRGFRIQGFSSSLTDPDGFKLVDRIFLAGDDWDSPLRRAIDHVKDRNGTAVFIGGGGVVKRGIEYADKAKIDYHLMSSVPGASQEMAQMRPERAFADGSVAWRNIPAASAVSVPRSIEAAPEKAIEILRSRGKKIVTFIGYSGAGYQDKEKMLAQAREILSKEDPARTIVNIGATDEGIGQVYKVAKEMGFETTGIVSSRAKGGNISNYVDSVIYVNDPTWGGFKQGGRVLNPTSRAMVGVSDQVVGIGGGEVGRDEMLAARRLKKSVTFVPADMSHDLAVQKAAQKSLPIPTEFRGAAAITLDPKVATPDEIQKFFLGKGKKVVTFIGYSGAEYEDKHQMLLHALRELKKLDPRTTVVNIGGTPEGIGGVYEIAKKMGFETTGIVSSQAKKYGGLSPWVDRAFYVEDATWGGFKAGTQELNPTSLAMVKVSDKVIGIGGGEVGRDEILAAKAMGKDVTFFPADMSHKVAIEKAAKKGQAVPTDFRGAAYEGMLSGGSHPCAKAFAELVPHVP